MDKLLFIGVPTLDTIKTETMASIFGASNYISVPAKLHIQKGCYIHDARNKIVESAIKMNATHILFIDSDIQFPPNAIDTLMQREKDIVAGLYYRRQAPHYPTINDVKEDRLIIPDKFPSDKLFEVFAIATGFMMVKVSVFKKIEPPWFYFGKFHGKEMGEDVFFCWKANKKGFKVWCDPTIPIGHVGEYIYTRADYDAYKDVREKGREDIWTGEMK